MVFTINKVGSSDLYDLTAMTIKRQLSGLNKADVDTPELSFAEQDEVRILMSTGEVPMEVHHGIIKRRVVKQEIASLEIVESAIELQDYRVKYGGSFVYLLSGKTVRQLVDIILDNSTGGSWSTDQADSTVIDDFTIYYSQKLAALFKLLKTMCGYAVWFDSEFRKVYWGEVRSDISWFNSEYLTKTEENDTFKRGITQVIVIGKNDTIKGTAGSGDKIVVYQYTDVQSSAEAATLAAQILTDLSVVKRRVTVDIPFDPTYWEGDLIKIDDEILGIKDVTIGFATVSLGCGAGKATVFDLLGNRLVEITGGEAGISQNTYSGGQQNIGSGTPTKFLLSVPNIHAISDFILKLDFKAYKKQVTTNPTYTNITATQNLSNVGQLIDNDSVLTSEVPSQSYTYIPNSAGILCTVSDVGFQLGLASISFTTTTVSVQGYAFLITPQYQSGSSGWQDLPYASLCPGIFETNEFGAHSVLIPGNTRNENDYRFKVRWRVTNLIQDQSVFIDARMVVMRVPRHDHGITDTTHATPEDHTVTDSASYASDVDVKIAHEDGDEHQVVHYAGQQSAVQTLDITSFLEDGNNTLIIYSTSPGSVFVGGDYKAIGS